VDRPPHLGSMSLGSFYWLPTPPPCADGARRGFSFWPYFDELATDGLPITSFDHRFIRIASASLRNVRVRPGASARRLGEANRRMEYPPFARMAVLQGKVELAAAISPMERSRAFACCPVRGRWRHPRKKHFRSGCSLVAVRRQANAKSGLFSPSCCPAPARPEHDALPSSKWTCRQGAGEGGGL